jgi:hypothetical protein
VGRVDFRTDLVLDRLEESNQTLAISLTRPVLDRDGKPVVERFVEGTAQIAVQQHDEVLSVRPNMRASFRPLGATPGPADVDLWKGSWMQVRAQD